MGRRVVIRMDQFAGVITPGGRVGDNSPLLTSERQNWVDKAGGLPEYIRIVRNALVRSGHKPGEAVEIAVQAMKRWAGGGQHVTPPVRAAAAKAVGEWEALRTKAHGQSAVGHGK